MCDKPGNQEVEFQVTHSSDSVTKTGQNERLIFMPLGHLMVVYGNENKECHLSAVWLNSDYLLTSGGKPKYFKYL